MENLKITKDIKNNAIRIRAICFSIVLITFGCTRDELDLPNATFPAIAEVFTDVPVNLTDEFFVSFDPAEGANTNGFGVDENIAYEGTTSIRIDVPGPADPDGSFIGGIFKDRGDGRNLTSYNALTFWGRASTSATIGTLGFGTDFENNTYAASISDVAFTTGWKKYIIPIPDPARLVQEKGMFIFSAGTQSTEGLGYTFWIDELKFENLASVAQPLPQIFDGNEQEETSFNGATVRVSGANVLFNVDGKEVAVNSAPAYFNFSSSDPAVAGVDDLGIITVKSAGTAQITATLGESENERPVNGSLTVTSEGNFDFAPTPPARDADDVVSIFSDAYTNIPVDNYNGFFTPDGQTTLGGAITVAGENLISYTNLNFVSINLFNTGGANASTMTHLHVDINIREDVGSGDFIRLQLINNNGETETSSSIQLGDYVVLTKDTWLEFDIPMSDFSGLNATDDIDLIFFVSDATISSVYVDNVYFYKN
ncbi:MAG: Ig-like domain-containing protein [Ekhidna sp.]|nr:Ig-like domain-containing protein [Ekhidna sp.]MBC6427411.1 Ig-like domain-containing protein [Ekhidna sp.]